VIGVVAGGRVSSVKKVKRDDKLCSLVPPGKQRLVVETITSSQSLFRTFGSRQIGITARLQPGIMYEVKLERSGDRVDISIVESSSRKVVSEKLSFDVSHPVLVPIPIPL